MKTILAVASIWALSSFVSVTTAERACSFTGADNSCYCEKEPLHTMCKDLDQTACSNYQSAAATESDIKAILDRHNEKRNKVASGTENTCHEPECDDNPCNSTILPAASNMNKLCWDAELAASAQRLADTCVFGHDDYSFDLCDRFSSSWVGQNIASYASFIDDNVTETNYPRCINMWYSEMCRLELPAISDFSGSGKAERTWAHFSQVIWAKSTAVGCGASRYIRDGWLWTWVVCNYGPGGNIVGASIYETSASVPPTLTCSADSTYPFLCACEDCKDYTVDASCSCSSSAGQLLGG